MTQDGWTGSSSLTYYLKTSAPMCGVSNYPNITTGTSPGYIQVH
jgi:hypothetical protein